MQKNFDFANIGFDTGLKLWFIDTFAKSSEWIEKIYSKSIEINGGSGKQIEFWDNNAGLHVRERIWSEDIESIEQSDQFSENIYAKITIVCKDDENTDAALVEDYDELRYAYSMKNRGRGFLEVVKNGKVVQKFEDRWILVENAARKTIGKYPNIRFAINHKEIAECVITRRSIIIRGEPGSAKRYHLENQLKTVVQQ